MPRRFVPVPGKRANAAPLSSISFIVYIVGSYEALDLGACQHRLLGTIHSYREGENTIVIL